MRPQDRRVVRLYLKVTKAYARSVFRPDKEEVEMDAPFKDNVFKRYAYYTIEDLMIVDDAYGKYVRCPMPKPFSIPGKVYWRALHIWQTKIVKTHV